MSSNEAAISEKDNLIQKLEQDKSNQDTTITSYAEQLNRERSKTEELTEKVASLESQIPTPTMQEELSDTEPTYS